MAVQDSAGGLLSLTAGRPATTRSCRASSRGGCCWSTWSSTPSRPPRSPPSPCSSIEDAVALARSLPRLRSVCLNRSYLLKQELLPILVQVPGPAGAQRPGCVGFDEGDKEVARRGARIERFDVAGSRMIDELQDELDAGELQDEMAQAIHSPLSW